MMALLFRWVFVIAAAAVAAMIPRGAQNKQRFALAAVAAFGAALVQILWPEAGALEGGSGEEVPHLLSALIFLPIVGAVAVLFIPRQWLSALRGFTLGVLAIGFIASLSLLCVPMSEGWHFQETHAWMPFFGILMGTIQF